MVQYFALIDDMNIYKNVSPASQIPGNPESKDQDRGPQRCFAIWGLRRRQSPIPVSFPAASSRGAAIARALVKKTRESSWPTSLPGALDEDTGNDVMKLFQRLKMKNRVIIIVTHDSKVAEYCDRIVYLKGRGECVKTGCHFDA